MLSQNHGQNQKCLPSGKRLQNYGKSPFSMGKSTISMAIFNSFLLEITRPGIPDGTLSRWD